MRLQHTINPVLHSGNWLPSRLPKILNQSNADVINLHWVADEMLSIEDIAGINKPLVWTLHDMWPFCGGEHYASDEENARWRLGYTRYNCPDSTQGIDLDRIIWRRKQRAWRKYNMHIVSPSQWLADCAKHSALFKDYPTSVIPNPLDTAVYRPLDRVFSRHVLNLPQEQSIILFGAIGGTLDQRKGFDLLLVGLHHLKSVGLSNVLCVVFGQTKPQNSPDTPFPLKWQGHLHDDATLALLYNAADVMIVPSRQEAFGQTASEAQACGCPVVAFNCTGLSDVVAHRETGYLAKAFESEDLANGMQWILSDVELRARLGKAARQRALKLWSPEVVVPQYLNVYQQAIDDWRLQHQM
jgi:glycosyltransferase involved in cell wall biosynthesis